MVPRIRLEEIYDASTDDECFDQLSVRFAEMLGARSGVIHWRPAMVGDAEAEISYSGYFSPSQMEKYDRHFTGCDLWSNAIHAPHAVNTVWDCAQLVPERVYENSLIYNEWIRPMGDDSFHAMGAAVRTSSIVADIGFHRGRSQGAFGPESVALLGEYVGHLRRMLEIRERLKQADGRGQAAAGSLDVVGYAVFSLTPTGRVLHHNAAAEMLLELDDGLKVIAGKLCATGPADRSAFAAAVERAGAADASQPTALLIGRKNGRPYEVSVVSAPSPMGRLIVVAVRDPGHRDSSLAGRLRACFGLSAAEAEVAVRLSEGASVNTLSEERRTTLETVRTQMKSIAAKLGCQRQAEIVAVVLNLPYLMSGRDR